MGIIESLIYLGIVQSLLLLVGLVVFKNYRKNKYLALFLIATLLILFGRLQYLTNFGAQYWQLFLFSESAFFFYGLTLFAHLKKSIFLHFKIARLHFVPLYVYLVVIIIVLSFYSTTSDPVEKRELMEKFHLINEAGGIIHNFIYMFLSISLINTYRQVEHENLTYEQPTIKYIYYLLPISMGVVIIWVAVYLNNNFLQFPIGNIFNYGLVWTGMTISTFFLSLLSIASSPILRLEEEISTDNQNNERLSEPKIKELKAALDKTIHEDLIYRNQQLKLPELSESINCSINDLSWLINNVYQKSFYDFINHYRIREFVDKLEADEHKADTLLAMAYDVGFNSKSTFNRAFKQEMHCSPREYISTKLTISSPKSS